LFIGRSQFTTHFGFRSFAGSSQLTVSFLGGGGGGGIGLGSGFGSGFGGGGGGSGLG